MYFYINLSIHIRSIYISCICACLNNLVSSLALKLNSPSTLWLHSKSSLTPYTYTHIYISLCISYSSLVGFSLALHFLPSFPSPIIKFHQTIMIMVLNIIRCAANFSSGYRLLNCSTS